MNRRSFLFTTAAAAAARGAGSSGKLGELPFRQIHLDFHTSELIPDVAADFDPKDFVATLQSAHVNSINLFAKGHHGYAYYNTKIATRHPSLKIDLLGEMIHACRPAGIQVVYYYSLVWDVLQARLHPEWRNQDSTGKPMGGPPSVAWPWVCVNSPYLDHLLAENREIVANYQADGAWFDILLRPPGGCFCQWCREERRQLGLTDSPADGDRHNELVVQKVEKRLYDLVQARFPEGRTFFNSRVQIGMRPELPNYTHIEIESLPTGGWGYTHFQQRVRYVRTLGKQVVGMTGRFHKFWGDFGGFKNPAALEFECLNFVANGAKACVGDQLHPRGRLDPVTYKRIGAAYAKVEALEPWSRGAHGVADIGVYSTSVNAVQHRAANISDTDEGFTNMLVELHHQFDVLDLSSDLAGYKLVIVPDEISPSPALVSKLEHCLASGGALLFSDRSLLDPASNSFALKTAGVRYLGPAEYKGEYMLLRPDAFPAIDDTAYFLYQPGSSVAAESGAEVLATYGHPYFDRSPEHYMSHRQTPMERRTTEPLIARRGKVVYIANPFFASYARDAYGVQKEVVRDLIRMLLPDPLAVASGLPSTAQMTVLRQPYSGGVRHIVHLLHYPLTRRAPNIDIIEEPALLENVEVKLRLPHPPARVLLAPQNQPLHFAYAEGYAGCRVARADGHQALVFE